MKKFLRKGIPLLLGVILALGAVTSASAAYEDFTDVKGHWAQETLRQAYNDGILQGYDAQTMAPDRSITTAQAVTILCRVLHVSGQGDTSAFDIPTGAWYTNDVAKAVYAGLLDESAVGTLEKPITRGQAFCLFGRAFQVSTADPDLSVLDQFPDAAYLTGETQRAAASLVESGVVNGSMGLLQADRSLTRAEFATILYRLADTYTTGSGYTGKTGTGTVLSGNVSLTGVTAGNLWLSHSASNVSLTDTSAAQVVVRSDKLNSFTLSGTGSIDKLVLAARTGDVDLTLPETYTLGTLTVGEGTGQVYFAGSASRVEVTGSDRTISIDSSIDCLTVSGENNTIVLKQGCTVGEIVIRGAGNTVKLNAKADTLLLAGPDNTISGSGRVGAVTLNTNRYTLTVAKGTVTKWTNYDIAGVQVSLTAPDTLAAGAELKATANLTVPQEDVGKLCTASWYINGELMSQSSVILGKDTPVSAITPNYTHSFRQDGTVQFVLTYTNSDGDSDSQEASAPIWMETFPDLGLADAEITVSLPQHLAAGQTLTASAQVSTPEVGKVCTGTWYVDGREVASGAYTLGSGPAILTYNYDYYYGMPETSTVSYRLTYTTQDGRNQQVSGESTISLENFPDNGIARAAASLSAPTTLEAGKALEVTAQLKYPEAGKVCTGTWYVDGKQAAVQTIVLGTDVPKLTYQYTYTENMSLTSEIKFVLTYTTQDGRSQQVAASTKVTLKNYDYFYYHNIDPQQVLNTVTSGYAGNYTLAWAQNHDYSKEIKTAWVNLKGYSSKTQYLVWVNLTYQRVNIFTGSQGNWTLVRTCLCGSGKASTPTIRGVFTTSYKQTAWDYGSYYCGPIVRFNGSSGYAFHSRLEYWPMNSDRYYDARIGFPVSHGCLRMYNDDIWYMYNNIPNGTTVVVY